MTTKEAYDSLAKDQKALVMYLLFDGRKPRRKQKMKATLEMNDAEFNDYRSMRDKIDNPNYTDVTKTSVEKVLLRQGYNKDTSYTDEDVVNKELIEQTIYTKHIEPRVDCEVVIRYIHKL